MKNNTAPLVSICTLVYNHEPYLRECFDGFLMQKTDFAFEVLVHDDASTDKSAEIIREYTAKYPDIFKPIYQTENQYSRGVKVSATFLYPRANGKYIALCEGDDYWTDPLKLQKQFEFLESHPDYVMCSHRFKIFKQDTQTMNDDWYGDITSPISYDLNALIYGNWFNQPLTVMFRRECLLIDEYKKYSNAKDVTLIYHLLKKGRGGLSPEFMAVYRQHSGGVWSCTSYEKQLMSEFNARIGICETEQSFESSFFLRALFKNWIPRKWMLKEIRLMIKSIKLMSKHFGPIGSIRIFLMRFFSTRKISFS